MPIGIVYATLAYFCWGLFPIFFKQLVGVDAFEVVMHRTVWSLVFLLGVLLVLRRWAWLGPVLRQPRVLAAFALSAGLLVANWSIYVWAIQHDHVLDASLGYFILPLINVALGFVFLRERPRVGQWFAVGIAAAGVVWLTVLAGRLPYVALLLALTFAFYGLLRKVAVLGALEGLTLETLLLTPFAAGLLVWWTWHGQGVLAQNNTHALGWLLLAGPITAIPLLMFAAGARRVTLATMGLLQYIAPSMLVVLGVWLYSEPFDVRRAGGFGLIWLALILYSLEGWRESIRRRA